MYLAAFLTGLTDSYNPCSIGVLIISLALLVTLRRPRLIGLFGISYLTTIFVTYFLIGVGLLKAFHLFGVHGFFGYVAGVVLIIAGLIHLFPRLFPNSRLARFLRSCHVPARLDQHLDKGVFIAGIVLGFLIGLCNLPCAGGIYLGIIGLLALKTTYLSGILHLFIFNIGFILPLVIVFLVATRESVLEKIKQLNAQIARYGIAATSSVMIIMGLLIIYYVSRT